MPRPEATALAIVAALAATSASLVSAEAKAGAAPATRALFSGTVVDVDRAKSIAFVRHRPFGGMPAMTMPFRLAPYADALRRGDLIEGRVNASTDPWTIVAPRVRHADVAERTRPAGVAAQTVTRYVPVLGPGDMPPALAMRDQDGRPVTWKTWRGQTLIVGFIYTRCRDAGMCPLVSAKFAAMQRRIAGTPLHLVEVTLDPEYDTASILSRYGRAFGAKRSRWTLVTGEPDALNETARRFGIVSDGDPAVALAHSEGIVIIGSDGRIADRIDGNAWSAGEIVAQARARAALPSNAWERLRLALRDGFGALCGAGASGISLGAALILLLALLAGGAALALRMTRQALHRDAG